MTTPLREQIVETLKGIFDPEIPVNIYDLGLIYDILIDEHNEVIIHMTLTSPNCPVAQTFPQTVAEQVRNLIGVKEAKVVLVWDPPWSLQRVPDAIKLELGLL